MKPLVRVEIGVTHGGRTSSTMPSLTKRGQVVSPVHMIQCSRHDLQFRAIFAADSPGTTPRAVDPPATPAAPKTEHDTKKAIELKTISKKEEVRELESSIS